MSHRYVGGSKISSECRGASGCRWQVVDVETWRTKGRPLFNSGHLLDNEVTVKIVLIEALLNQNTVDSR